jgi:hypothetical protein
VGRGLATKSGQIGELVAKRKPAGGGRENVRAKSAAPQASDTQEVDPDA